MIPSWIIIFWLLAIVFFSAQHARDIELEIERRRIRCEEIEDEDIEDEDIA